MDPQTRFQALTWLIAFIGGFGMLVIVVLAAMWRRHLKREQRLEHDRAARQEAQNVHVDMWQTAGERLGPIQEPAPPDAGRDDDDEPWREDNRGDTWDRDPDEDDEEFDDRDDEPPWR